jgi:hypothetical protein
MTDPTKLRYHPDHWEAGALPPLHVSRLYELLGTEKLLTEVERALRTYVQGERPPVVGALHLTCSDEAEFEVADVFRREFVRSLLPALHFDDKAPFRTANLGGRYEWGSARAAEGHFSKAPGAEVWKMMVIKINAHVGADSISGHPVHGRLSRYGSPTSTCAALHLTLDGDTRPFALELEEQFSQGGVDRLGQLRATDPDHRALLAAACSARLQARRVMLDVQDHTPATPTVYLVLPCVTFNRHHHDSEMLLGIYVCDRRGERPHDEYCGLGDRPEAYRLSGLSGAMCLTDDQMGQPRHARDHRAELRREWAQRRPDVSPVVDQQLEEAVKVARATAPGGGKKLARVALRGLLATATAVAPVPAAIALFGEGAIAIHHAARAHRLAREADGNPVARRMLDEVQGQIDGLSAVDAQHLIDLLVREYGA